MELLNNSENLIELNITGKFVQERYRGNNSSEYSFDTINSGVLNVTVLAKDNKEVELDTLCEVKVELFGKYYANRFGEIHVNNLIRVKAINEAKLLNNKGDK